MEDNIFKYIHSIKQILSLFKKGIISELEYEKIEAKLCAKYCINIDSLIRTKYLIKNCFRVINVCEKESIEDE